MIRKNLLNSTKFDGLILIIGIFILWQLATLLVGSYVLPGPISSLKYLAGEMRDPDFIFHLLETSKAFALALFLSILIGLSVGLSLGISRMSGDVMEPIIITLYSIPKITLYPIVLLIFGLGISAKVAFGVMHGVIPIILFTMTAVRNIPPVYVKSIRAYGLSSLQGVKHVLIPAAIPEIVAGLRIGFSLTLLGTLIGEMFASQRGVGYLLMLAMEHNNVLTIVGLSLILFVFATSFSTAILYWERRLRRV